MNTDCFRCGAGEEKSGKNKTRSFSLASIESFPSLPRQRKLIISIPCRLYHVKLSSHSSRLYCGFKLISLCRHRLASSPSSGKRCGGGKKVSSSYCDTRNEGWKVSTRECCRIETRSWSIRIWWGLRDKSTAEGRRLGEARIMKRSPLRTLRPSGWTWKIQTRRLVADWFPSSLAIHSGRFPLRFKWLFHVSLLPSTKSRAEIFLFNSSLLRLRSDNGALSRLPKLPKSLWTVVLPRVSICSKL